MGKSHQVKVWTPQPIDAARFARNGMIPNAALMRRLAQTFNFISNRCKKQVFAKCQPFNAMKSSASGASVSVWPFFFRTGEETGAMRLTVGLGQMDVAGSTPNAVLDVYRHSDGVAVSHLTFTFSADGGASTGIGPNQIAWSERLMTGLAANTEYYVEAAVVEGARLVSLSVAECDNPFADDSRNTSVDLSGFVADGPIYDVQLADLIQASNLLWKHDGAHLLSWCTEYDESEAPVITSTSYINVLDSASTTVTGATPGFGLFTQYHRTVARSTVPVRFAVKADRESGAGSLSVRFTDGTNSIEHTGITTGGQGDWYVMSGTVPAQAGTKWDLQAKVTQGSFSVIAASLYEWED